MDCRYSHSRERICLSRQYVRLKTFLQNLQTSLVGLVCTRVTWRFIVPLCFDIFPQSMHFVTLTFVLWSTSSTRYSDRSAMKQRLCEYKAGKPYEYIIYKCTSQIFLKYKAKGTFNHPYNFLKIRTRGRDPKHVTYHVCTLM